MRVNVDQSWCHQLPGGIDNFTCGRSRDIGPDRGNPAVLDRDIRDAIHTLRCVEDPPAANHQIVFSGKQAVLAQQEGKRAAGAQKLAAAGHGEISSRRVSIPEFAERL